MNKSAEQHSFSMVPTISIKRSRFERNSKWGGTFDFAELVPFYIDEVVPGDTYNVSTTHFTRLATPQKPIMDNMYIDFHYFFVPMRLVWENWVKLQGEQDNPDDDIDYSVPQIQAPAVTGFTLGSLADRMGLPLGVPLIKVSALPFRMYNLIYNQWYRSETLIDSAVVDKGDADSNLSDYVTRYRAKRHDYFTSCLPYPQKGDDVLLPLGSTAPVVGNGEIIGINDGTTNNRLYSPSSGYNVIGYAAWSGTQGDIKFGSMIDNTLTGLEVDLTQAAAATVSQFREAFAIQRQLERDARGGTRYPEILKMTYGVLDPSMAVLQRPVYLGGGTSRINVTPVPQTSVSATTPQGNLAGYGVSSGESGFVKSFTEHGYIIGICSARADLSYYQGVEKHWLKKTRYDFYMPVFANLSEQPVLGIEIYAQAPTQDTGSTGTPDNEKTFGWQEAWADYRYKPSKVTGLFRPGVAGTLSVWNLTQQFSQFPTLGQDFIEENPPVDRCIAVPSEPHLLCDIFVQNIHTRGMPMFSIPGLIDHN